MNWIRWAALAAAFIAAYLMVTSWGDARERQGYLARAAEDAEVGASAVMAEVPRVRGADAALNDNQTRSIDELQQRLSGSAQRAADLERRLHDIANSRRSTTGCQSVPASAGASSISDEPPAAGLSDMARSDLVRLAQSANDTADTLKACRRLLRQAWQSTAE